MDLQKTLQKALTGGRDICLSLVLLSLDRPRAIEGKSLTPLPGPGSTVQSCIKSTVPGQLSLGPVACGR